MERNTYIDFLRGVAILLVMLLHFSLAYRLPASALQAVMPVETLRAIFYNGNYGVSMFFVISGFLITTNTMRRYGSLSAIRAVHFYRLRFFRLYPLVVVALLVIALLGLAGFGHFRDRIDGTDAGIGFFALANLSVLTFWHNVLMESAGYFNYAMNIYWSLSVEEVFYLAYPLLLIAAPRPWQRVMLACTCLVIGPVYRDIHRDDELFYLYGNLACIDMLAFGCIAAVVAPRIRVGTTARHALALAALVAMGWIYLRGIDGNEAMGASWLGLGTAVFLVAVSGLPSSSRARRWAAPLAWLGARSYELYLFHIVVLGIMVELVPRDAMTVAMKLPMLGLFLALSMALAWAMARGLGDPLNRWLRRRYAAT